MTRRQKNGPTAGENSSANSRGAKSSANGRQHELKLGEVVTTIPTTDFNAETVEYKNLSVIVQKDTEMTH